MIQSHKFLKTQPKPPGKLCLSKILSEISFNQI